MYARCGSIKFYDITHTSEIFLTSFKSTIFDLIITYALFLQFSKLIIEVFVVILSTQLQQPVLARVIT